MSEAIITSLLDTDLYKFTMMQCALHHFPGAEVQYRFMLRKKPLDLRPFKDEIEEEIRKFCTLTLSEADLSYLASLPYIKPDFIHYLRSFRLNVDHIQVIVNDEFQLHIKGPWVETILFEVPLLAIISEVYTRNTYPNQDYKIGRANLQEKIELVKQTCPDIRFSDFGTRRRFSKSFHQEIIQTLAEALPEAFIGTSNVYFSKLFNLKPIGTMAHEFLQACQVLATHIKGSQQFALHTWLTEYPHYLKIALTDTLTMDVFLQEFDKQLALAYEGMRQDSGDPFEWSEKALRHYHTLGIDARKKTFVYSNGLTMPKAISLYNTYHRKANVTFGIGTNLTNDVGHPALDIVIKMTHTNGFPVVKISDSKGKVISEDAETLQNIKKIFNIKD